MLERLEDAFWLTSTHIVESGFLVAVFALVIVFQFLAMLLFGRDR